MPKVSVIITTHNRSYCISECLDSVLKQTFKDFEIIVVDDGSTDNTREVLKKYADKIHYIYEENKGRAEARNSGIRLSQGEYIAFLDDDDIWMPEKLERQVSFLDSRPDIGLVHTYTEVIDERGLLSKQETRIHTNLYKKAVRAGYTYAGMSRFCIMFTSTVMLKKSCLKEVGLFDPKTVPLEDWDFYLRFTLKFPIGTLPQALATYRLHKAQRIPAEHTLARINVSIKHLAILESLDNFPLSNQVRLNFYMHLANAYYISKEFALFRSYLLKALKLNPFLLFSPQHGIHFLASFLPAKFISGMRQIKHPQPKKTLYCSERIIPEETAGGSLGVHLKRYDFAKQFCKNKVVLDAACGVGYGSSYLADAAKEVTGADVSKEAIIYAKEHYKKANVGFELMDIHNLEFPDKNFDVVCSFETLEHLDNPQRYIAEVRRVLKDDGVFIISTPNIKKTTHDSCNPHHKIEFSKNDFEAILKKAFSVVEVFGQRRFQSNLHYYLQKADILNLRALLPGFIRRNISHGLATRFWDEAGPDDFIISKDKLNRSLDLIAVCRKREFHE